jgi:hypothetical protein
MLLWDKDREDQTSFVPNPVPTTPPSSRQDSKDSDDTSSLPTSPLQTIDDIVVTKNRMHEKRAVRYNPVSHWRVSSKPVTGQQPAPSDQTTRMLTLIAGTGFAFSPDLQYCAVTSEDGYLRVIDAGAERSVSFIYYYGPCLLRGTDCWDCSQG